MTVDNKQGGVKKIKDGSKASDIYALAIEVVWKIFDLEDRTKTINGYIGCIKRY